MDELVELNLLALEKALHLYSDGRDGPSSKATSCVATIREAVLRFKSEVAAAKAGKRGADKAAGKTAQLKGSSVANGSTRRPSSTSGSSAAAEKSAPQLSVTHVAHVDYLNRITSHLKESSPARPLKQLVLLDAHQQRQLSLQDNLQYVNSLFKSAKDEIGIKSSLEEQEGSLFDGGDAGVANRYGNVTETAAMHDAPDDEVPEYEGAAEDHGSRDGSAHSFSPELFSATSGQPIFSDTGEPLEAFWIQGGSTLAGMGRAEPALSTGGSGSFVQKKRQQQDLSSYFDELADAFEMPP